MSWPAILHLPDMNTMYPKYFFIISLLAACLLSACGPEAVIPADSTPTSEQAAVYPDYRDITVPPNICPLNLQVTSEGDEYVAAIAGKTGEPLVAAADAEGKLQFDPEAWRTLLGRNKGADLTVTIYARRDGSWVKHPAYTLHVAAEPIDRYLSYRLIEPGYEVYRQLGLYQRDLESFEQKAIYENNRSFDSIDNHCVNCHNYQNYDTQRMLFHVRGKHGGTVFVNNGQVRKVNMKCDSILSAAVYPTWHPRKNWIVFSSNLTGQAFHMDHREKIEVMDYGSDLVFYDADRNTLTNILRTDSVLETFPCFAPDGKKVYYCSAAMPLLGKCPPEERQNIIINLYDSVRYDLMSLTFDEQTQRFGPPVLEVDCRALGRSATVPRVSPDGRYLLFTLGDYGQFHVWHKSSDLYVKDLRTGQVYPLADTNSPDADSYHSWSSNGRWIVFSSRRDDGSYTRPYIAYFDKQGRGHKAFLLPQADPEQNTMLLKSYNVPELTRTPVSVTPDELKNIVYDDKRTGKVSYRP